MTFGIVLGTPSPSEDLVSGTGVDQFQIAWLSFHQR